MISTLVSDTLNSTSATKSFNLAASSATTGPPVTVTTSTPSTFSTLSPADIRAAAVSVMS